MFAASFVCRLVHLVDVSFIVAVLVPEYGSIITVLMKKGIMCPLLHDLTVIEYQYQIRILDGGDAVGDDKDGAGVINFVELLLNITLSLHIDGGCGVVENQDGRLF